MTAPWEGPLEFTVEQYAKYIYETGQHRPHSPAWEQLGDVTRSVWLERALAEQMSEFA